ncbi:hypothetical protein JCM11251_005855 [Rhodosporidiobolus azoricus]
MSDSTLPPSASVESHRLVASFLRSMGYSDTLEALLRESSSTDERLPGLIERPSTAFGAGHDLQDVVEEYLASRLARSKLEDPTAPLVDNLKRLELKGKLPDRVKTAITDGSNVLTVQRGILPKRSWDSDELRFRSEHIPCLFTTAVDRSLKVYSTDTFELLDSFSLPSPALALAQHPQSDQARFVICATMEGSLTVIDLVTREVKAKVKDHVKYIVRAAWSPDGQFIATLGYDKLIHLYRFSTFTSTSSADVPALLDDEAPDLLASTPSVSLELVYSLTTRTNPEAAVFLPDSRWLVWSARDDHLLHYLNMPADGEEPQWETETYNLNENGDAFVSFSVLSIALHPTLPLLSLQTSTTNARLLLYPYNSSTRLLTLHTTAQQSEYFAPRQTWLPSGAGVAVNSEDGIVRLVDLQGRVRLAKGAHGPAAPLEVVEGEGDVSEELKTERARARREADKGSSVIRDVEVLLGEEPAAEGWRLVSCGFDKTVKVLEGL